MSKDFSLKKFKINKLQINASKAELVAAGQKQAAKVPIKSLGLYKPVERDVVKMIKTQEDTMIPELLPLRHQRMTQNAFSFLRGTAGVMAYDLLHESQSQIKVMICGDAHLNNFGFFASPERQLLFGLNDFDETKIGNWESDLKRLLVSVNLIGELNGYDKTDIYHILKKTANSYVVGIQDAIEHKLLDRFYESYNINDLFAFVSNDKPFLKILKKIAEKAPKNNSDKVVRKFTTEKNGKLIFKENPPRARRIPKATYRQLEKAVNDYQQKLAPNMQILLSNFKLTDIIRYSVGVGSFGTRCYLVLLTGKDDSHLVLQIKEALPSKYDLSSLSLTATETKLQGFEEGRRVIAGQSILQTFYDPFLGYTEAAERSYYVRQFRDMKDSIDATKLDADSFTAYARMCAFVLAKAHFQSPTAPLIYGYIQASDQFPKNMAGWAVSYSKQVHEDYNSFQKYLRGE